MGKRLLAALLALYLVLLPAYALAAGRPASTDYWIDMTTAEARQMLSAVASGSESRYIVFVYYGTDSPSETASQQFSTHANNNKCPIYNYAYTGGAGGESLADELAALFGGTAPTTLPVAVTFNPSTGKCIARENVATLLGSPLIEVNGLLDLMKENGVSSGSTTTVVPDIPSVDPDPGTPDLPSYPNDSTSIPNVHEQAWEVLRLVNRHRMSLNLQPLSVFNELQQAANLRAVELYTYFSHTRPDGRDFSTVFPQMGIAVTIGAENIASGQRDGADAMSSWLNSSGHRANIENPRRVHLGVGYYYNSNNPSAAASNWVQNFVACDDCSFSNLRLSSVSIMGSPGADLESLLTAADIEVTAVCYRHGLCSLPLIAAMCSGYDANAAGDQTLTVTYGGQTAVLTVHTHTWDNGTVTTAASCTETGSMTYACPECGETREETIPAAGHSFVQAPEGGHVCGGCQIVIPSELAQVYEALRRDRAPYAAGSDAAKAAVEAYLKGRAEAALRAWDIDYICDILDGKFVDDNTKYEYRIGFRRLSGARLLSYEYDLITEPLILVLKSAEPENPVRPPVVLPVLPTVEPEETEETFSVSVAEVTGGQVSVSSRMAGRGESVTISVEPDSGYILGMLEVTDAKGRAITLRDLGEGKYSFSMPASKVTIHVTFEKAENSGESPAGPSPDSSETASNPAQMTFMDVQSRDWFYDSVEYVWKHNLMNGVSDTRFAPDETVSRAMIWTILARMSGEIAEVPQGSSWYEPGMLWAVRQGVSDGTNPMDGVTREQLAAMLWRNAGSPSAAADLSGYSDGGKVSGYAQNAMLWAVESGIMQGADGTLNPGGTASRAEAAAMIARYAGRNG